MTHHEVENCLQTKHALILKLIWSLAKKPLPLHIKTFSQYKSCIIIIMDITAALHYKTNIWQIKITKTISHTDRQFCVFTRYHVSNQISKKWMKKKKMKLISRNTRSMICCKLSIDNNIVHWKFLKHPSPDENAL